MLTAIIHRPGESFAHCPAIRGYAVVYRENEVNFCPGCGRSQWYIGRLLAECAYCGTAVPLADAHMQGGGFSHHRGSYDPVLLAA